MSVTRAKTGAVSPRALLALQGMGFSLLTVLLYQAFSTGKGVLLLGAIVGAIGVIWLLRSPHLGVWILFALWFLEASPSLGGIRLLSVPKLLGLLLFLPLTLSILRERRIWIWEVPQVKILLLIGIFFLVSTGWSYIKYPIVLLPQLDETDKMANLFLTRLSFLFFFLYFITTPRRIEWSGWLLIGLTSAAAVSGLSWYLSHGMAGRAHATFGMATNPNYFAHLCLVGASLLWFYRAHGQSRWRKFLTYPLLFVTISAVLVTGSRNGFLQLLVLSIFIIKEQKGWSLVKRAHSLLFAGSLALMLMVIVPTTQLMRATSFDPSVQTAGQGSLRKRIDTIYASVQVISSNPVLGVGIGNFRWMHQILQGSDREPHNSYLGAFAEGGIFVLALYLSLFYTTFRMLLNLEESGPPEFLWLSKGLKVSLVLMLIFSVFGEIWHSEMVYIIIGLTVAMTRLSRQQEPNPMPVLSRPLPLSPTYS